jgi:hypothetical protein
MQMLCERGWPATARKGKHVDACEEVRLPGDARWR